MKEDIFVHFRGLGARERTKVRYGRTVFKNGANFNGLTLSQECLQHVTGEKDEKRGSCFIQIR